MNKSELSIKLAKRAGLTHAKAGEAVNALFHGVEGLIAVELARGGQVTLPGFGSFVVRKRAARQARNPATGKKVPVPARSYPGFRVGKTLKEKVAK
jgi:DNA-binding protein HU-beta